MVERFKKEYPLPQAQIKLKLKLEENSILIKEIESRLKQGHGNGNENENENEELQQTRDLLQQERERINAELDYYSAIDDKVVKVIGEAEGIILKIERKFGNRLLIERAKKNIAEVNEILHRANEELRAFVIRLGNDLLCLKQVLACLQTGGRPSVIAADDEEILALSVPSITTVFSEDQIAESNAILNGYLTKSAEMP